MKIYLISFKYFDRRASADSMREVNAYNQTAAILSLINELSEDKKKLVTIHSIIELEYSIL